MRFDIENQFSVEQVFTVTAVSANSYQKQTAEQDISIGRRMAIMVLPVSDATGGATYELQAIQATNAALTAGVDVLASVDVGANLLNAGEVFEVSYPQASMTKQFLGLRVVVTGGGASVVLDSYLVPQDEIASKFKAFPKVVDALV
jgi:hypothetical protein